MIQVSDARRVIFAPSMCIIIQLLTLTKMFVMARNNNLLVQSALEHVCVSGCRVSCTVMLPCPNLLHLCVYLCPHMH